MLIVAVIVVVAAAIWWKARLAAQRISHASNTTGHLDRGPSS